MTLFVVAEYLNFADVYTAAIGYTIDISKLLIYGRPM